MSQAAPTSGPAPAERRVYSVAGMSCDHCVHAVETEVRTVPGVDLVEVDLAAKRVTVQGSGFDDASIRAAVEEAGYDVVAGAQP